MCVQFHNASVLCVLRQIVSPDLTFCQVAIMLLTLLACVQVPLMSEIVQAWLYTSDNNMGIFDCNFNAKACIEGSITDAEAAAHCDDNASSASPAAYGDTAVPVSPVDDITAHHIWVGFFLQTWQVCATNVTSCKGLAYAVALHKLRAVQYTTGG